MVNLLDQETVGKREEIPSGVEVAEGIPEVPNPSSNREVERRPVPSENRPEAELQNMQKEAEKVAPEVVIETPHTVAEKDPVVEGVEGALSEALLAEYKNFPPDVQKALKQKGEETAQEVVRLFRVGKLNNARLNRVIKRWLSVVPGGEYRQQVIKNTIDNAVKHIEKLKHESQNTL